MNILFKNIVLYEAEQLLTPFWSENWYVTVYVISLIITPYLNWIINNLSQEKIKKLLIVFFFIPLMLNFQSAGLVRGGMVYFPYFYLIVGYLKRFKPHNFFSKNSLIKFCLLSMIYLTIKFFYPVIPKYGLVGFVSMFLPTTLGNDREFSFIVGVMSLLLFYGIKDVDVKHKKVILIIGKYTFVVYLLHSIFLPISRFNKWLFIWDFFEKYMLTSNTFLFVAVLTAMICVIYLICLIAGVIIEIIIVVPSFEHVKRSFNVIEIIQGYFSSI